MIFFVKAFLELIRPKDVGELGHACTRTSQKGGEA
jgi:hypothetical protein